MTVLNMMQYTNRRSLVYYCDPQYNQGSATAKTNFQMLEAYIKERSLRELESQLPEKAQEVKSSLDNQSKESPLNAHALQLLARCHLLEDENDSAKQTLENLLGIDPGNVTAKVELAKIVFAQNDAGLAIKLLTEVTGSRPELVGNWLLLKEYLQENGQQQESRNALMQYDMIKAFNDELKMAEQAYFNAEFVRADNLCRKLLTKVPGEFRVLSLLARIARKFRHYEISTSILAECIKTRPVDVELGLEYAHALFASKRFKETLDQCDRLIGLAPEKIDIFNIKAEALYNLGQYQEAIEIYRQLSEEHENHELFLLHLGKALKTVGETTEAIDCFHRAVTGELVAGQAYWELASLKTYRFSDSEIVSMQALASNSKLSVTNKMLVQFALGKALEDSKQFSESFQQYQAANSAYIKIRPYRYSNKNKEFKKLFSEAFFIRQKEHGNDSSAPIFVVGLPRSGSTLVEQILTSHSKVDATMELTGITSISRQLNVSSLPGQGQYPQSMAAMSANEIQRFAQEYLDYAQSYRLDAPGFVDKAPGNFHHIGLIKTLFPNARIIDIRRHPMASGWSLYRHFFAESFLFSYDLTTIGKYYNDYIELMDHWHSVLPGQILTLSYEDLVNDFETSVNSVLAYCGLPFEEACLNFHLNKRAVATPSSEQVRQPIYADALEHWKNYEEFLLPLKQMIKNSEKSA